MTSDGYYLVIGTQIKMFSPTIDIPFNLDLALSILAPLQSLSVTFQECKHTTAFYYFLSQQISLKCES